jgi:hypothetical protein
MNFDTTLIPYQGDDSWVDVKVEAAVECFNSDATPDPGTDCDNYRYFEQRLALD